MLVHENILLLFKKTKHKIKIENCPSLRFENYVMPTFSYFNRLNHFDKYSTQLWFLNESCKFSLKDKPSMVDIIKLHSWFYWFVVTI